MRRLGALIIGDEILAGHVHDTNTYWLAKRLRGLGIHLARVEVCSDDIEDIAASVRRFLLDLNLDYVVTSGGLGPTPDDRTMEGLAQAIGEPLVTEPEWAAWMNERVRLGHEMGYFDSPVPNAGLIKMTLLPRTAHALLNQLGTALGARVDAGAVSLFTLPGVPREFERMFDESVAPQLTGAEPDAIGEVTIYSEESRFFDLLSRLEMDFPDVKFGSYPHRGCITIRATGGRVDEAVAIIREAAADFLEPR